MYERWFIFECSATFAFFISTKLPILTPSERSTPGLIRAKGPILQSLEILHPSRYENALTLQPAPTVTPGPNMTFGSMIVSWPRSVSNEKKTVSGATR